MKKEKQTKIDQWGDCGTPKVWRSDSMSIKPQDEKERNADKTYYPDIFSLSVD